MAVRTFQSWKEIAQYMRRGVRTVQRWEAMYGLPVHRPAGRERSAVFALEHELDKWMATVGMSVDADGQSGVDFKAEALFNRLQKLEAECELLRNKLAKLGADGMNAGNGNGSAPILVEPSSSRQYKQTS